MARDLGVTLQLDPTFQPHYELYTGLVFQLVCAGSCRTSGDRPRRAIRRPCQALWGLR